MKATRSLIALLAFTFASFTIARAADPLPSWNTGSVKKSILTFVEKVTKPGSPDFVPVPERIATFDNDGTLWCEKPLPVQLFFVLDRVKALATIDRLAALTSLVPRVEFGDEQGAEVFYNFSVTPWFHLNADLQWISPARGALDQAWVGGLRASVSFQTNNP